MANDRKHPSWREELAELGDATLEERLTPEQRMRLEALILENPAARTWYVEYLHQHAVLTWSGGQGMGETSAQAQAAPEKLIAPTPDRPVRYAASGIVWWALAASLLIAVGFGGWWFFAPASTFATLASAQDCRWYAGSLPTESGSRLGAGRLRLAEGVARLEFDNGTAVMLEAPADLELVSSGKCVLRSGRLVAKVPAAAIGFQVDTPTALLKDLGTEFGVHVPDGDNAYLQVFDGIVDIEHRSTGKKERVTTGKGVAMSAHQVIALEQGGEPPTRLALAKKDTPAGAREFQLTTATGRGQDAYVQPIVPPRNWSTTLLLVKRTTPKVADWDRKAYVGIDLAPLHGLKVLDAELTFTLAPTGMGFASEVPDATFAVYGVTDENMDIWSETGLKWDNAAANQPGPTPDPAKSIRLGTFTVNQGITAGARSIGGPALIEFLSRDRNGLATFILVRETQGSGRMDLVHGFASKRHPTLPPPTLKVMASAAATLK